MVNEYWKNMKEFIGIYWKKHLLLLFMCLLITFMMIYLNAYQGMLMLVVMLYISLFYIIIRDVDRFEDKLNLKSKKGKK